MNAFVNLTTWIPVAEAKAMIARLIEEGAYEKQQIKKSSNLFANKKDKSDGYVCRVLAIKGLHPELELPDTKAEKKSKKNSKKVEKNINAAQRLENQEVDNRRYIVTAKMVSEDIGLFLVDQNKTYWVESQNVKNNDRTIISPKVHSEEEAKNIWLSCLMRAK